MKTDHRHAPARFQVIHTLRQHALEFFELAVDINPYSLKGTGRRVFAWFARTYTLRNKVAELFRGDDFSFLARSNNRPCNLPSKPFFAVITYHLRQFVFIRDSQPLRRRLPPAGIHAHIQRSVETKAEAALLIVQLRRR